MNKTSTEMQKDGDTTVGGESSEGLLMGLRLGNPRHPLDWFQSKDLGKEQVLRNNKMW